MEQRMHPFTQTIATSLAPEVLIEQVLGNLQVKGWDRPEVSVKANPDELTLEDQDDLIRLSCRGNISIMVPEGATVRVENVHGEARFKLLDDQLLIEEVLGSLVLRGAAETHVESVNGELLAKRIHGNLTVDKVSGNATIRRIQGDCLLENVGGNLDVRDVESNVKATAGGNARVRLGLMSGNDYQISAGGNVHCRIPEDASVNLDLNSGGQFIQVKLPGATKTVQASQLSLTQGGGEASMKIMAGGSIFIASQEPGWPEDEEAEEMGGDFDRISEKFSQQIAQQVESQVEAQMDAITRQLNEQMANLSATMGKVGLSQEQTEQIIQRARETGERATARAQERMRRAQERLERKLEAARRKEEMKAQTTERRSHWHSGHGWNFVWPTPPAPPAPSKEPVSDEERLIILRMLEQKKISLEEAEKLLASLEDKGA